MRFEGDEIALKRNEDINRMTESDIDYVIKMVADPLARLILTKRLNFVLGTSLSSSRQPDAEDLYQTVMLKVAGFLANIEINDRWPSPDEMRGYLARIIHNVCNDFLRQKYPERSRLKDRIRDILKRHRDFDMWNGINGVVCGFKSQRGQAESPQVRVLLLDLAAYSGAKEVDELGIRQLERLKMPELLAELFRRLGGPINIDHLINIISEMQGIKDRPHESIDTIAYSEPIPASRSNDGFDLIASQELLHKIWRALCEMKLNQRRAYLYIQTDYEGQSLLHVIIHQQAVALNEILQSLELTREDLILLLQRVPMDTTMAAIELGTSNSMIAKWKHRALRKVRAVLEK